MNYEDAIYNRYKVEKKLKMVRNSLYGFDTPLSEYVCEKKGVLSDEKIEALADRLISIMVRYGDYRYGMAGAHRRCLQLFIYLAVKAYGGRVETFGDILEAAADMMRSHNSLEELILYETDWQPEDEEEYDRECIRQRYPRYGRGFWGDLDQSYMMLSGHRIGYGMKERELKEIWDRYMENLKRGPGKYDELYLEDEGRDLREYMERQAAVMEYEERLAFEEAYGDDDMEPSFRMWTEEEREEFMRKEIQRKEKWKASFQGPKKFLEAYKEFRSLFFSIGFDRDGLKDAIVHFLCREGRSGLTDSERFLRVHIQLDNAYRTAAKR